MRVLSEENSVYAAYTHAMAMREFDALCLPLLKSHTPAQIKRMRYKSSQAVFAAYLNTSPSTVQKWAQIKPYCKSENCIRRCYLGHPGPSGKIERG